MSEAGNIDAVFTWVDGADPQFLAEKEFQARRWSAPETPQGWEARSGYTGAAEARDRQVASSHSSSRFRDKGELLFAVRSIRRHAPWIRNIYIVTNGQIPSWLDNSKHGAKIVTHAELFPDRASLPCYNSNAIESVVQNISGLSENFIYFNDDFFIGRDVSIDDFIAPDGAHRLFVENRRIPRDMTDRSMIAHSWAFNNALLDDRVGVNKKRTMFAHSPQIYNKHLLNEIYLVWREHFDRTRRNRFRTAFDAAFRILYTYYVGEGKRSLISQNDSTRFGTIVTLTDADYSFIKVGDRDTDYRNEMERVLRMRPMFLCINDEIPEDATSGEAIAAADAMGRLLTALFPEPSPFELPSARPALIGSSMLVGVDNGMGGNQPAPEVAWNDAVSLGDPRLTECLVGRWHAIEADGVWTDGPVGAFRLRVEDFIGVRGFELRMALRVLGANLIGGRLAKIKVRLDSRYEKLLEHQFDNDQWLRINVPLIDVPEGWDGQIFVTVSRLIAPSPVEMQLSADARSLGVMVGDLQLVKTKESKAVKTVAAPCAENKPEVSFASEDERQLVAPGAAETSRKSRWLPWA